MIFLANPTSSERVLAMMERADVDLGFIDTPRQANRSNADRLHASSAPWCADNGCFTDKWNADHWWDWLNHPNQLDRADTCLFATAPDVVGDAAATLDRSLPWLPKIRSLGYPAAFVAQNGIEHTEVPWDDFDVLFLGGDDDFKEGPVVRELVAEANDRGKWVHCGRVNTERRWLYMETIGCHSADGTILVFGPDVNLRRVLTWLSKPTLLGRTP